ncbi:GntR family transcriptional regulator [Clostridium estertheticum]|uniref:GntR family transcriptional regulator n=1 Tax=Clostridium estertheticum TaxID=238834 RepID=UPI0013E8FCCA|nr:GntR family transcriptional regulator [Clostridium estertheticum]MBZ9685466.1 GntR family transcriptional regulator [Clostridium estertheticum]
MNIIIIEKFELNKNSSIPLYFQLQNHIINNIKNNKIKEGDMLPTEIKISNILEISRPTVRQALANLVNEGYLNRIKGKGTFVTKPIITQEYTSIIESYNVEMSKKGFIPKTKVLELEVIDADENICKKLQIKNSDKVIKLKRLRYATQQNDNRYKPVLVTTVYMPYKLLPELISYDFEVFSFYEVLDKYNLSVKNVIRELEAKRVEQDDIAKLLDIETGAAVHFITSIGFLLNGTPIEYSESTYPGERNKFIIKISK